MGRRYFKAGQPVPRRWMDPNPPCDITFMVDVVAELKGGVVHITPAGQYDGGGIIRVANGEQQTHVSGPPLWVHTGCELPHVAITSDKPDFWDQASKEPAS